MKQKRTIVVVGGVAAGPAAAAEAHRVDPDAHIILFEEGPDISYGACEIPQLLEGLRTDDELVRFSPQAFENEKGVQVRVNSRVESVAPKRGTLQARDSVSGAQWEENFDQLIIATGAKVALPAVKGIGATNVFPIRSLESARRLREALVKNPGVHCVVVGAGYVGIEAAEALSNLGHRVTLLAPGGLVLPQMLDPPIAKLLTNVLVNRGIVIRDERMTGIVVDPANRVQALLTSNGERIGCTIVILATGLSPNVDLATAAGARIGSTGALCVTDTMKTSLAKVWACGDCIEVERVVDGASVYSPLSPTAYRTARVAAQNAARTDHGAPTRFPGVAPASAVRVFDFEAASVGLTLSQALESGFDAIAADIEHWSRVPRYPNAARISVRYIVERGKGRLLGAQLAGADGAALRANVLVPLIRNKWTVDKIDELDFVYNPPVSPPLDPLYVAARAAIRALES